ncbi:acetamidase/formamidase family protein [Paenibacillus sp. strain BS8-2]
MTKSFQPSRYYDTIGWHQPQLYVKSGETITVSTLDAGGWDQFGEQAAPGGNPLSGPVHIEGAEPGDMLEITWDSIVPSRDWGWSLNMAAPHTVDPSYAMHLTEPKKVIWHVDVDGGLSWLKEPSPALSRLKLPLRPFLGCFGVAPPGRQAITTFTSGEYGGNMDYNGFVAGTTTYLPVFAEGALLHLGDGHALQGDGEIVGAAIEISMDVTLTVRVHKQSSLRWPRGESDRHLFTVGNARPLDQALQHATTEMMDWLMDRCKLTVEEASQLLGQAGEYRIANVYNPAYSVVCLLDKRYLAELQQPG